MTTALIIVLLSGLAPVTAASALRSGLGVSAVEAVRPEERAECTGAACVQELGRVDTWLEAMCRAEGGEYIVGNLVRRISPCVVKEDWKGTL
jgi:hypothetical protein